MGVKEESNDFVQGTCFAALFGQSVSEKTELGNQEVLIVALNYLGETRLCYCVGVLF